MDRHNSLRKIVAAHQGTITAHDDYGTYRVEFTWHTRSAGFYDDMFCRDWAEILDNANDHVTVKITK